MTQPLVLLLSTLAEPYRAQIAERYQLLYAPTAAERAAQIAARGAEVRVVLTIGTVGLSAAEIDAMPRLELVCTLGVGYERVDVEHARARGIALANGAGTNDDCVADQALGLLLAAVRRIPQNDRACREGLWRDALPMSPQVAGKRMGILGLGTIGRKIAQRARGFDIEVGYHNRKPRADVPYAYFGTLAALAAWCDFLVIATPGGAATRHMVDAEVLAALGPRGYLVNIARGSVVDTAALADALAQQRIAGAALDVYESEPERPETLLGFAELVLSPHVSGRSPEAIQNTVSRFIANADGHFAGRGVVSPI
ncbi:2-hydroxyacid dehydrogenase [Xylophilus sp. ASV27]|uniref:2-hydroxyacid dehydrogenase n=1 Tax=Xylophilus sp. ASV27 TaxID=2795129 RepID=UPI0018ED1DD0|nr:2-hydroxyacid dehydrogenase [Xylophilus sp. ASV27]